MKTSIDDYMIVVIMFFFFAVNDDIDFNELLDQ